MLQLKSRADFENTASHSFSSNRDWVKSTPDSITIISSIGSTGERFTDCCKTYISDIDREDKPHRSTISCSWHYNEHRLFFSLLKQWHKERGITSSQSDIVNCASYRKIIGMGIGALPLILGQLKHEGDDPDHWFVALESITNEDPIPESSYGDMAEMAKAWLSWASKNNVG